MFSHGITASSSVSAAAAISAAVAEASSDFKGEAKSIHIIVTSIIEINGVWVANVLVLIAPDLDEELEEDLKPKKEQEKHLDHKKDKDLDIEYDLLDLDYEEIAGIHVYFPIELEDHMRDFEDYMTFDSVSEQKNDFYFHLIEDGPLWRAVEEHPLDIEFYEATHEKELKVRQGKESHQFQENMKAPRLQRKMHGALQELEPE